MSCESMSDLPTLCTNCLGDRSNLRMTRHPDGEECKICTRPFTAFRWNIKDNSNKTKKTIICKTCSTTQNCCQCCMLDINFLIPVDIRDTALRMAGLGHLVVTATDSRNTEVRAIIADKQAQKQENKFVDAIEKNNRAKEILSQLAAKLKQGSLTVSGPIKSAGGEASNEVVARFIKKLPFTGSISPPQTASISSFFMFGVAEDLPQYVISDYATQFGKIKALTVLHRAKCAFISFTTRKAAEAFAQAIDNNGLNDNKKTAGLLILDNKFPVRVVWSELGSLGVSSAEYEKVGQVVNKVMLQLSEKDKKSTGSTQATTTPISKTKKNKPGKITKPAPKKYLATNSSFEL